MGDRGGKFAGRPAGRLEYLSVGVSMEFFIYSWNYENGTEFLVCLRTI